MKKGLKDVKVALIVLAAAGIGLSLANAVVTDAKADETILQADEFIQACQKSSAGKINVEAKHAEYDGEIKNIVKKAEFATASDGKMTFKTENGNIDPEFADLITGDYMTPEDFRQAGVIFRDGWKYTWYSEKVLPGEGLQIPGRWSDGNFVRDHEGFLCVACNDLPQGTEIETPFGMARVYDWVGDDVHGLIDIYVSW